MSNFLLIENINIKNVLAVIMNNFCLKQKITYIPVLIL